MFTTIEPHQYNSNRQLLDQMYRLRKAVFHDVLKWDVDISGNWEYDRFDDLGPVYLVWCNADASTLYGSMRLMPTTGPTLLYDVFRNTFPNAAALAAPGIWEATRTCVHTQNLARDHPDIPAAKAFGLLILAAVECALSHGIHTVVANYEPALKRIYDRSGAVVDELGRADGYGRYPVCCGAFETSDHVVTRMRERLDLRGAIFGAYRAPKVAAA